jgi:hypothetical protein
VRVKVLKTVTETAGKDRHESIWLFSCIAALFDPSKHFLSLYKYSKSGINSMIVDTYGCLEYIICSINQICC